MQLVVHINFYMVHYDIIMAFDSINKCGLGDPLIKILRFLAILRGKKIFCKSIPNGLKRVKNTKSAKLNFCRSPVPAAGGRPILPLENVNTSYHTEFHQILTINVAWVPKRH